MKRRPIDRRTRFQVLNASGFRCRYCGRAAPEVALEVDHLVPVAKGGSDLLSNLGPACFDCNRGKRTQSLIAIPIRLEPMPESLRLCGDMCFTCPVEALSTLPVAVSVSDGHYVMTYRCQWGHEWQTSWAIGFAEMLAAEHVAQQVPCWPPVSYA